MSLFITFEGGEGCGKTTQASGLYRRMLGSGIPTVLTYEPGGTPLGRAMRRYLKRSGEGHISPLAELFLIAASRAQLVTEVIGAGLEKGRVVICDRYTDSTLAYQGYGRGLDLNAIRAVNGTASRKLSPDLTILLDMPPAAGLARKKQATPDRFEREDIAFHQRVRDGYLQMAAVEPQRWLVVDAQLPRKEIEGVVWTETEKLLRQKGLL